MGLSFSSGAFYSESYKGQAGWVHYILLSGKKLCNFQVFPEFSLSRSLTPHLNIFEGASGLGWYIIQSSYFHCQIVVLMELTAALRDLETMRLECLENGHHEMFLETLAIRNYLICHQILYIQIFFYDYLICSKREGLINTKKNNVNN